MPGSAHGPGEAVQLPSSVCQSIKVVVLEEEEDDDMRASLIRRSKGWKKQRGKERWPELAQRQQANDVIPILSLASFRARTSAPGGRPAGRQLLLLERGGPARALIPRRLTWDMLRACVRECQW